MTVFLTKLFPGEQGGFYHPTRHPALPGEEEEGGSVARGHNDQGRGEGKGKKEGRGKWITMYSHL